MKKHYIVDANLDKKYHFYNYPEHHLTFRDLYPHTAFCEYEAAHCIFSSQSCSPHYLAFDPAVMIRREYGDIQISSMARIHYLYCNTPI